MDTIPVIYAGPVDPDTGYPVNWDDIARAIKTWAGWVCEHCYHPHDVESGHVLTVHHLDGNPGNNDWTNLLVCCQRCHLSIQARYIPGQIWFDPPYWLTRRQEYAKAGREVGRPDKASLGMLWYEHVPVLERLGHAMAYYLDKYGRRATWAFVHVDDLPGEDVSEAQSVGDVLLHGTTTLQRWHVLVGG